MGLRLFLQDQSEVFFKIKKSTRFSKMFDAYCARQGIEKGSVRFLFEGERVSEEKTPEDVSICFLSSFSHVASLVWKMGMSLMQWYSKQVDFKANKLGFIISLGQSYFCYSLISKL